MSSTTTTSTDIQRTIAHEVYGGAVTSWSGNNVTASGDISDTATTYSISDTSLPWQLEIVEKSAGIIAIDITEDVTQSSTTTSLSPLSVTPAFAEQTPEVNNSSNPVAAATGNVVNQNVNMQKLMHHLVNFCG